MKHKVGSVSNLLRAKYPLWELIQNPVRIQQETLNMLVFDASLVYSALYAL